MNVTAKYPKVNYRSKSSGAVSNAGMLLLTETARALGLVEALSVELDGFARPKAVHLPGKAICDLAVMLAAGGDCPADVVMLRARPHLFGKVASDPTVSRIIGALASDPATPIAGIAAARAYARAAAGRLPAGALPEVGDRLIVDLDATLVASHSEKELAAPNYKRGFGFHPILAFADHGTGGTGAPMAGILRPGNAGSNTATDHIAVTELALAQLDSRQQGRVLIRADSAGGTKAFTQYLADKNLAYSVGFSGFLAHLKTGSSLDRVGGLIDLPAFFDLLRWCCRAVDVGGGLDGWAGFERDVRGGVGTSGAVAGGFGGVRPGGWPTRPGAGLPERFAICVSGAGLR